VKANLDTAVKDAGVLTTQLNAFAASTLMDISDEASPDVEATYNRGNDVGLVLSSCSVAEAQSALVPLQTAMRDALRKATNCRWQWAIFATDEEGEKVAVPFNSNLAVSTSADAASVVGGKRSTKALEGNPDSALQEDLATEITKERRSITEKLKSAFLKMGHCVAHDMKASAKYSEKSTLEKKMKQAKKAKGCPEVSVAAVGGGGGSGSSSASGSGSPGEGGGAPASGSGSPGEGSGAPASGSGSSSAATTPRAKVKAAIISRLKKNIDLVVSDLNELGSLYDRNMESANALAFFNSADNGSCTAFFHPSHHPSLPSLPSTIPDGPSSYSAFCQEAIRKIAKAMFGCSVPTTGASGRPKRDDIVHGIDSVQARKKKEEVEGETEAAEKSSVGYGETAV